VTGLTLRHVGERFQQSNYSYIVQSDFCVYTSYFQKILVILLTQLLYSRYIQLPTREFVSQKIRNNPKFWLFFKDAIGAIDGSHIHAAPPAYLHPNH
ncbi:hypothetical protein PAXRUDRAFT_144984, partial [Paxillus rubicundulus Ve08.2h10]